MENKLITGRLARLRSVMSDLGIDYYLIPTADPHSSEYVADHFQTRHFFSGFSGSNGTLVVGKQEAGLWTDGRYFIQAQKELSGTGIDLYREGEKGVPSPSAWIASKMVRGGALGFDGRCVSVRAFRGLEKLLKDKNIRFVTDRDPAEGIWTDRPPRPANPVFVLEEKYAGEGAVSKLERLRKKMRKKGAGIYVENRLDNLMWLFNIRGSDVECTPVALSFGVVTMDRAVLFIQEKAVSEPVRAYAQDMGIELRPYDSVYSFLEDPALYLALPEKAEASQVIYTKEDISQADRISVPELSDPEFSETEKKTVLRVLFEPAGLNVRLWGAIRRGREKALENIRTSGETQTSNVAKHVNSRHFDVEMRSPVEDFKAAKNRTELENIRSCYREDSAAVCRFLYWLHRQVEEGTISNFTELDAAKKMDSLRAKISDFMGLSFGTISAYGPNAAMMHYSAREGDCARLEPRGMLLVDCGGQYLRGTTDVTRTMALGPVTESMRRHYTLTAVGNLQLLDAVFLYGCTGRNLDILARQPLWQTFVDYKCGTGHGIGYLLGVHEGPQNIRWRFTQGMQEAVLEPGMIVSDEPGVYIEGQYGIRIETILEVVEAAKNGDGEFLRFKPLTLVPLDPALIDPAFLTQRSREVLNKYHARVFEEISPFLKPDEKEWLRVQTQPIG